MTGSAQEPQIHNTLREVGRALVEAVPKDPVRTPDRCDAHTDLAVGKC
jgi:hypothetical protein